MARKSNAAYLRVGDPVDQVLHQVGTRLLVHLADTVTRLLVVVADDLFLARAVVCLLPLTVEVFFWERDPVRLDLRCEFPPFITSPCTGAEETSR